MGRALKAKIGAFALVLSAVAHAEQDTNDHAARARELQRESWKWNLAPAEGEDPEARAAEILVVDAAAATLGDEGWKVRARCARALRDIAPLSPTARNALEGIADDTSELFGEGLAPQGSGDAWVYAMHGLGRLDEIMAWIEQRIEAEPRRSRRFAATWSSMDDAMVAAGCYDLYAKVHGDMKYEAMRTLTTHAESMDTAAARAAERPSTAYSDLVLGKFSSPRRSAARVIDEVATRHAALLVIGKDEDAWAVAGALLEAQDTPEARASLAMHAVRAGVAGRRHAEWLAQAIERIPADLQVIERAAAEASIAPPPMFDALDPLAAREEAFERLEKSDDPAIRENARAIRQRLEEMREMMKPDDEPPY